MFGRRRKSVKAPDALDLALSTLHLVPVATWTPQYVPEVGPPKATAPAVGVYGPKTGRLIGTIHASDADAFPGYVIS